MIPTLTKKLFDKYPKLFAQKNNSAATTAMCWGFECEEGWFWLIDILCNTIQSYIDANEKDQIEFTQIKEKYGGLCCYTDYSDDIINGMIWLAEDMSAHICERCGSNKNVTQTNGWIKTLCEECL